MTYNATRKQYVLTIDDVTQRTNYTSDDIQSHNIDLRTISEVTYRVLYGFYKGPNPARQAEIIREMIEASADKREALLAAMIEMLHGAMVSGMDLNQYISSLTTRDRTQAIPDSVKEELRNGGLAFTGDIL